MSKAQQRVAHSLDIRDAAQAVVDSYNWQDVGARLVRFADALAAIENDSALRTAIQRRGYWATEPHHADAVLNALLKVCPTLAEER